MRDATQVGRECPTFTNSVFKSTANETQKDTSENTEDCLNLSVYSTDLSASRPVMVYFHGGGFYEGAAHHHPPNYLLEEDVVLVVAQYRLGPLGFLSTDTSDIPGNAAILDAILALRWVQSYIRNFGGDPNRVTIFGQSAGAGLVSLLILSPAVPDGLFHGALMQSGSAFGTWVVDERPEEAARDIARHGGCNSNGTLAEVNACLMAMDVRTLMVAFTTHKVGFYLIEAVLMLIPVLVLASSGSGHNDWNPHGRRMSRDNRGTHKPLSLLSLQIDAHWRWPEGHSSNGWSDETRWNLLLCWGLRSNVSNGGDQ